jgi:hypothetical protein
MHRQIGGRESARVILNWNPGAAPCFADVLSLRADMSVSTGGAFD